MIQKKYIDPNELLNDSFRLAAKIYKSGFRPSFIVGVWRGGSPIGIAVQEFLSYLGIESDHIAIRSSVYFGINQQDKKVEVHNLDYLLKQMNSEDRLLIVDDVFDSGRSVVAILDTLHHKARKNLAHDVRIATPWYKPTNNVTDIVPDYFLYETDKWLVFPHEIKDLSREEIMTNKADVGNILSELEQD